MTNYYQHPVIGYVTNFGHVYCTAHEAEKPGALGTRTSRNVPHVVDKPIRDGWDGTPCEWPGCRTVMKTVKMSGYEYVSTSLHETVKQRTDVQVVNDAQAPRYVNNGGTEHGYFIASWKP
jgi:hypothetical protein